VRPGPAHRTHPGCDESAAASLTRSPFRSYCPLRFSGHVTPQRPAPPLDNHRPTLQRCFSPYARILPARTTQGLSAFPPRLRHTAQEGKCGAISFSYR
jgi:hypothetical protein